MPLIPIAGTDAIVPAGDPQGRLGQTDRATDQGFSDSLTRLIGSVQETGQEANAAVTQMLDGSGDVHEAMIALQRADLTFQLTMQVRNKLVQAYERIMRMPV